MQTFIQKNKYEQYNIITADWLNLNEQEFQANEKYLNKSKLEVLDVTNALQITYEDIFETKNDISKLCNYLEIKNLRNLDQLNLIDPAAKKLRKVTSRKLI